MCRRRSIELPAISELFHPNIADHRALRAQVVAARVARRRDERGRPQFDLKLALAGLRSRERQPVAAPLAALDEYALGATVADWTSSGVASGRPPDRRSTSVAPGRSGPGSR